MTIKNRVIINAVVLNDDAEDGNGDINSGDDDDNG